MASNLKINGGVPLFGEITPSGNKNSVLPIICATVLTKEKVTLKNVPALADVKKLIEKLKIIGSTINWDMDNEIIEIQNDKINEDMFKEGFPIGMRGATLLLPPLIYRMKSVFFENQIGGCSLGIRELDPHIDALKSLGVKVQETDKGLELSIKDRFSATNFWPDYMSVTTTENFINGAILADGTSKMVNAASEPHVQELCNFLIQMGAKIEGVGSSILQIEGVKELKGTEYTINSDHHEITTFLALGAMTGGEVIVNNALEKHFTLINQTFHKLGVNIEYDKEKAIVRKNQKLLVNDAFTKNMITKIEAAPWPYFPVDLLPLMMALATKAKGEIMFWNKVYESGLLWLPELQKFGAKLVLADPHRAIFFGGRELSPAIVNSPNIIRAAISLSMVALSIDGESHVKSADPIKRAHPHFEKKLQNLGANIEWYED